MRPSARRHLLFWSVALLGLLLDQAGKFAVFSRFDVDASEVAPAVPGVFGFLCHYNYGALWGLGEGHTIALVAVSFAAMGVILWLFVSARPPRRITDIALAVMMAGAMGNQIDRLAFGCVRDFIKLSFWETYPVFNVADSWLVIGVGLMLVSLATGGREEPKPETPASRRSRPTPSGRPKA